MTLYKLDVDIYIESKDKAEALRIWDRLTDFICERSDV